MRTHVLQIKDFLVTFFVLPEDGLVVSKHVGQ
jgi:hypothetical protein